MNEKDVHRWWIEGGAETCGFCLERYSYEGEYRCVECDRAVCPMCVLEIRGRHAVYCPECQPPMELDEP
jgi:hypothetical protein